MNKRIENNLILFIARVRCAVVSIPPSRERWYVPSQKERPVSGPFWSENGCVFWSQTGREKKRKKQNISLKLNTLHFGIDANLNQATTKCF